MSGPVLIPRNGGASISRIARTQIRGLGALIRNNNDFESTDFDLGQYDARESGAVLDGTTDDLAALQDANVQAAKLGQKILIPYGTAFFSNDWVATVPVELGPTALLKPASGKKFFGTLITSGSVPIIDPSTGGSIASSGLPTLTPQQFGARGAPYDDTGAFVAAVAAMRATSGGARLYVPAGHYLVAADKLVLFTAGAIPLVLEGSGYQSLIEWTGGGSNGINGQSSNISVRGLRFTGVISHAIIFSRPAFTNLNNMLVEYCYFNGVGNLNPSSSPAPLFFNGVDSSFVNACQFSGNGIARTPGSINLHDTSGVGRTFKIGELIFVDSTDATQTYRNTQALTLNANATIAVDVSGTTVNPQSAAGAVTIVKTFATGIALANASCSNPAGLANTNPFGYEILYFTQHQNNLVQNCIINMTHSVIGIAGFSAKAFRAIGNVIDGGGFENGSWSESGYGGMNYKEPGDTAFGECIWLGNRMSNCAGNGLYIQGMPNSTVVGNVIETCGQKLDSVSIPCGGIVLNNTNDSCVQGNTAVNCGNPYSTTVTAGIVVATGTGNNITGNSIDQSNPDPTLSQYGVRLGGACQNSIVVANNILNPKTGITTDLSGIADGSTIIANTIKGALNDGIACDDSKLNISSNSIDTVGQHGILSLGGHGSGNTICSNTLTACTTAGIDCRSQRTNVATNNVINTNNAYVVSGANCQLVDNHQDSGNITVNGAAIGTIDRHGNNIGGGPSVGQAAFGAAGTASLALAEVLVGDIVQITPVDGTGSITYAIPVAGTLNVTSSAGAGDNGKLFNWEILH